MLPWKAGLCSPLDLTVCWGCATRSAAGPQSRPTCTCTTHRHRCKGLCTRASARAAGPWTRARPPPRTPRLPLGTPAPPAHIPRTATAPAPTQAAGGAAGGGPGGSIRARHRGRPARRLRPAVLGTGAASSPSQAAGPRTSPGQASRNPPELPGIRGAPIPCHAPSPKGQRRVGVGAHLFLSLMWGGHGWVEEVAWAPWCQLRDPHHSLGVWEERQKFSLRT